MAFGIVRSFGWEAGGGFAYDTLVLETLAANLDRLPCPPIYLSTPTDALKAVARQGGLSYGGIPIRAFETAGYVQPPPEQIIARPVAPAAPVPSGPPPFDAALHRALKDQGIAWLLLLEPNLSGVEWRTPFVMPIHDLQHRLQPHFPEVCIDGEFARREHLYRQVCRHATLVLVDSEIGKQDVLDCYGELIGPERIRVVPFTTALRRQRQRAPEAALDAVRRKYLPPERYFFYPAQFWSHKNHMSIVVALDILQRRHGIAAHAVFCGSYGSRDRAQMFQAILQAAEACGLAERVRYLGFVPDAELPALYRGAEALVMPTFFGPTVIPIAEAWQLDCPVITSRVHGITEMAGDAALLADPGSPADLAEAMRRLWTDPALRADLVARGRDRAAAHGPEYFDRTLLDALAEADAMVREGRSPSFG